MHEIVGADDVIAGKTTTISGIRVLAPYRLRIRLTKPVGDLIARLTMAYFCPLLPNTPIDPAGIDNPPGGGPYYVAERVVNKQIVLKRNPLYRGAGPRTSTRSSSPSGSARPTASSQPSRTGSTTAGSSACRTPPGGGSRSSTASTARAGSSSSTPG
jgi:ABC-type transport system substrate-binding protein